MVKSHTNSITLCSSVRCALSAAWRFGWAHEDGARSDSRDNVMDLLNNAYGYHYVRKNTCCLMCFEHLAATCHRKIVARKIKELDGNGLQIKNI